MIQEVGSGERDATLTQAHPPTHASFPTLRGKKRKRNAPLPTITSKSKAFLFDMAYQCRTQTEPNSLSIFKRRSGRSPCRSETSELNCTTGSEAREKSKKKRGTIQNRRHKPRLDVPTGSNFMSNFTEITSSYEPTPHHFLYRGKKNEQKKNSLKCKSNLGSHLNVPTSLQHYRLKPFPKRHKAHKNLPHS